PQAPPGRSRPRGGPPGCPRARARKLLPHGSPRGGPRPATIDAAIEVTEPLGMETLVFFRVSGIDVCGRVSPTAGAREGVRMRLAASLDNMHLIDDATGSVL